MFQTTYMTNRPQSKTFESVSRRSVLTSAATVSTGAVAGCLGGADDGESDDSDDGVSEESRELAAEFIETIDTELSVEDWRFGGLLIPEYADSGGLEADAIVLGDAYADIVDRGFDHRAMPSALDDSGDVDFMVFLEPEWAIAYLEGEWSTEEYYAEIRDSEH